MNSTPTIPREGTPQTSPDALLDGIRETRIGRALAEAAGPMIPPPSVRRAARLVAERWNGQPPRELEVDERFIGTLRAEQAL